MLIKLNTANYPPSGIVPLDGYYKKQYFTN